MADVPTKEPLVLTAGDTWKWKREDLSSDYPAPTWTLKYYLVKSGVQKVITASADGEYFSVTVAKATTAAYAEGIYDWDAYVDDGSERFKVDSGTFEVKPDLSAQTTGYDGRSHAKKVLDAIEAVIEGRASIDQQNVAIAGQSLARTPIPDLLVLRDRYKAEYESEVAAERIANGLGSKRKVKVRFV